MVKIRELKDAFTAPTPPWPTPSAAQKQMKKRKNKAKKVSDVKKGFLSGNEEFETGSENDRPLDGNPDKGIELGGENNGGVSERYKIYVANKDDDDLDSLENSMANEEESGGVDVPVAQVSMDDEVLFSQLSTKTFSLEVESK
ncbi:hypothetical protein GOBAR_DD27500 [Gossypium barbadense]|nr:hypothetical protein GOBAR_DD27500 [Gossypium barbadense]